MPAEPDPLEILRTLERHGVRYVLIGAAAARVAGAPVVTEDIDVTPATSRGNLERLAAALRELDARLRSSVEPQGVAFPVDPEMLIGAECGPWSRQRATSTSASCLRAPAATTTYVGRPPVSAWAED